MTAREELEIILVGLNALVQGLPDEVDAARFDRALLGCQRLVTGAKTAERLVREIQTPMGG